MKISTSKITYSGIRASQEGVAVLSSKKPPAKRQKLISTLNGPITEQVMFLEIPLLINNAAVRPIKFRPNHYIAILVIIVLLGV